MKKYTAALSLALLGLAQLDAVAAVVAQAGPNPIPIDQTATTDNVQVLLATLAERNSTASVANPSEGRKNFYIQNFNTTSDYLAWTISLPAAASYQPTVMLSASGGQQFSLSVNGSVAATFTATGGWQRQVAPNISLPAGSVVVKLARTGTLSGSAQIKSLELLRASDVSAYTTRVAAARANTTWLSQAKYGLMFQYGSWGFPAGGGAALPLDQQAANFNVTNFVNMVKSTGASYVIWSISWWGYHMDAPLVTPNDIVTAAGGPANPHLTASTDLIGNVASALQAQGIRFALYYHTGDEDSAWWPYQFYPTSFSANGTGDRTAFFNNWKKVVTEIGQRYGSSLDGFFFDDGCIYYPAPFEALQAAARTGNPNRLVSWNGSVFGDIPVTDFQDVQFGEGSQGQATTGSATAGGNGLYTSGPNKGLLQHGMFTLDNDWGVHQQGQQIVSNNTSANTMTSWIQDASSRGVPISPDLMMYEDGTVSATDLAMLQQVKQNIYGGSAATVVNDSDSGIVYSGSFSVSSNRNVGDYANDVHYTATNGDSATYTFFGNGIDFLTEKYSDEGQIDVAIDGSYVTTVNAANGTRLAQQVLYSQSWPTSATHTIKLTKKSGTYMLVDAFRVYNTAQTMNDTNSNIAYAGTWTYSGNRNAGDFANDVHYTRTVGDSVSLSFSGSKIEVLAPTDSGGGNADVSVDGMFVTTVSENAASGYNPQQVIFSRTFANGGAHTIKLSLKSGSYLQIDAFRVYN